MNYDFFICSPKHDAPIYVAEIDLFYHLKGVNQQRVSTEIIIEMKQLYSGRMAWHPLIESIWCSHRKWTVRLKYRHDRKPLKFIENGCTHCTLRLFFIEKCAHRKGNIKHVWTWSKGISSNFSCPFRSKIAKMAKDKCTHRLTNPFDASISSIAGLTSPCGYTPWHSFLLWENYCYACLYYRCILKILMRKPFSA